MELEQLRQSNNSNEETVAKLRAEISTLRSASKEASNAKEKLNGAMLGLPSVSHVLADSALRAIGLDPKATVNEYFQSIVKTQPSLSDLDSMTSIVRPTTQTIDMNTIGGRRGLHEALTTNHDQLIKARSIKGRDSFE